MQIRNAVPDDYEWIRVFLAEMGWAHRVADPLIFRAMMENTSRAIVASEGARVIGFGRALCDEVSNGYISMVAVAEDRREEGIGREIVRQLMQDDPGITWVLRAGHGSERFWEAIGFKASSVTMERVRKESSGEE
jgi:N-acetylglutamate synthase-like GNAT family acetyltransferase